MLREPKHHLILKSSTQKLPNSRLPDSFVRLRPVRKIDFAEPNTVVWQRWQARCNAAMQAAISEEQQGGAPVVTSLYKSQKAFYAKVTSGFFGKCTYCEQKIMSNQHGDLDHYRPKKQPSDINWSPVRIRLNGKLVAHPGYYWLA
jgi:hypothetical protein